VNLIPRLFDTLTAATNCPRFLKPSAARIRFVPSGSRLCSLLARFVFFCSFCCTGVNVVVGVVVVEVVVVVVVVDVFPDFEFDAVVFAPVSCVVFGPFAWVVAAADGVDFVCVVVLGAFVAPPPCVLTVVPDCDGFGVEGGFVLGPPPFPRCAYAVDVMNKSDAAATRAMIERFISVSSPPDRLPPDLPTQRPYRSGC
jgi:hypothetical protein